MSDARESLAERIATRLASVAGVSAIVLGGSLARGTAREDSDVDIGLYYEPGAPPSLAALNALAREIDDRHPEAAVTAPGEWGRWVNGGAWLIVEGHRVDWLYRDLGRVRSVLKDCVAGRISADYYLGHPHAFHNYIYMGEVQSCRALHDPAGVVAELKRLTVQYPAALRAAIVARYLFDARFMLDAVRKPAAAGDVFHTVGCFFRVTAALVQVLFAVNERYFVNEKGALAQIPEFATAPPGFVETVTSVLASPGADPVALMASVARLDDVVASTASLAAGVRS